MSCVDDFEGNEVQVGRSSGDQLWSGHVSKRVLSPMHAHHGEWWCVKIRVPRESKCVKRKYVNHGWKRCAFLSSSRTDLTSVLPRSSSLSFFPPPPFSPLSFSMCVSGRSNGELLLTRRVFILRPVGRERSCWDVDRKPNSRSVRFGQGFEY